MRFPFRLRRRKEPTGELSTDTGKLFLASVVDEGAEIEGGLNRSLYLVLAHSEAEAVAFVRGARLAPCVVGLREHSLPLATAIKSYSLTYGAARLVWPRDATRKQADDYLFVDEPRNADEIVLLGVMRGAQQSVATVENLLAGSRVSAA